MEFERQLMLSGAKNIEAGRQIPTLIRMMLTIARGQGAGPEREVTGSEFDGMLGAGGDVVGEACSTACRHGHGRTGPVDWAGTLPAACAGESGFGG